MRRLATRAAALMVGPASVLLMVATMGGGPATASSAPASVRPIASARAVVGHPADGKVGRWKVERIAPGFYTLTWTSPTRLPYTDARPEVVTNGRWAGPARLSANGRSVSVTVASASRPAPADFDVLLSGKTLDGRAQVSRQPKVRYARPAHLKDLAEDPGFPGSHRITVSDYSLDPVKLPDIPQKAEMVGHVVAPDDATDSSPLVLFLHGRHQPCYKPAAGAQPDTVPLRAAPDAWECPGHQLPVPSYLGYDYVQRLLASQGYVTVSISADAINALDFFAADGGAAARAALIRHHLDAWVGFVGDDEQHADLGNVILVGHSRGGEGADRASLNLPSGTGYQVTGQVLIGPTDFGFQAAPFTPTITVLPYCDGDVSDLQGQNFTDDVRDLTSGPIAFHSSILVMGANHNFFNSEWTPGISAAPSFDDWFGPKRKTCGVKNPARLTAAGQRKVGKTYIAGAVHLFADNDQDVLPMFDGSSVAVGSADDADVRSHAIGGGLETRRPRLDSSVGDMIGAHLRLCTGVSDAKRAGACEPGAESVRTPHWPSAFFRGVPLRKEFELTWTRPDQATGIDLTDPWDLSGDAHLDLRTIVDPTLGRAKLEVELFDGGGGSAVVAPEGGGTLLPLPGGSYSLSKRWAQTLRVPLDAVTGVDLTDIVTIDLIAKNPDGRVWVVDMSAGPTAGITEPAAQQIPLISFGKVKQAEGDGPGDATLPIPYHVRGDLAEDATLNVAVLDPFSRGPAKPEELTIPAHTTDGTFDLTYTPNTVLDFHRRIINLVAFAQHGIQTDRYIGTATIIDDDPPPSVALKPVARRVIEGESAQWTFTFSAPFGYSTWINARPVRAGVPGPQLTVGDLPKWWIERHLFPIPPLDTPLPKTDLRIFQTVREGHTTVTLAVPIRRDKAYEGRESISLRFRVHGLPDVLTSTVTVVDPPKR
jgi:hypothetical protein